MCQPVVINRNAYVHNLNFFQLSGDKNLFGCTVKRGYSEHACNKLTLTWK